MKSDFVIALTQLASERNLPREIVLSAIEAALISAYKRDSTATGQDISVTLDPSSGEVNLYLVKTVVDEVEDPLQQLTLAQARKIKATAEIGEVIVTETLPQNAGRIAAQTAKQVVIQRLREAERDLVFQEFSDKEGDVFTVTIQRIEQKQIMVDLGRAEATLPPAEQVPFERYRVGQRLKVVLQSIRESTRGPEIIVSRADKLLVKRLFEMEVPEIFSGSVEIVAIAREPGSRAKVAVWAKQDGVDAVGSCVGLRGIRIQNIVNELHGEKIDVVQWDQDPLKFIASALSPSQVMRVDIDSEAGSAIAMVPDRQLSLAIGKDGQNARLAARLTGLSIDIKSHLEAETEEDGKPELKNVTEEVVAEVTEEVVAEVTEEVVAEVAEEVVAEVAEEVVAEKTIPEQSVDQEIEEVLEELIESEDEVVEGDLKEGELLEAPAAELHKEDVVDKDEIPEQAESTSEETPEEPEPTPASVIPEEMFEPQRKMQPTPVAESTSLQDLSEDVWSLRGVRRVEDTGGIRFAEDIDELKRGGSSRGSRRGGSSRPAGGRARKSKTGKKR